LEHHAVSAWLVVIAEREALRWVLASSRFAFPATTRREIGALTIGDRLFLLTTRGCFHNPGRDRTRVIGEARVTTAVKALDPPVNLAGRDFPRGCDLEITRVLPWPTGPELPQLVPRLSAFADKGRGWSVWLRRPLVAIGAADADLLSAELDRAVAGQATTLDAATAAATYPFRPGATSAAHGTSSTLDNGGRG
jgi:hypothetical protein